MLKIGSTYNSCMGQTEIYLIITIENQLLNHKKIYININTFLHTR